MVNRVKEVIKSISIPIVIIFMLHAAQCVKMGVMWPQLHLDNLDLGKMVFLFSGASCLSAFIVSKIIKPKLLIGIGLSLMVVSSLGYCASDVFYSNPVFIVSTIVGGLASGLVMVGLNLLLTKDNASLLHSQWMVAAAAVPIAFLKLDWIEVNISLSIIIFIMIIVAAMNITKEVKTEICKNEINEKSNTVTISIVLFSIVALLSVGSDTLIGNGLTTFMSNSNFDLTTTNITATLFFTGIFINRLLFGFFVKKRKAIFTGLVLAVTASGIISICNVGYICAICLFIIGWGIGSIFPYFLSISPLKIRGILQACASAGASLLPILLDYVPFISLVSIALIILLITMAVESGLGFKLKKANITVAEKL